MRELKPEYQELADDYRREHSDRGCTCFLSPPCNSCIHPGNPENLAEDEDAWVEIVPRIISSRRAKYLRKRGKPVYWDAFLYSWVYPREVQHV